MSKLIPVIGVGCVSIVILGLIIGGAAVLIYHADELFSSTTTEPGPRPREAAPPPKVGAVPEPAILKLAREHFKTKLIRPANGSQSAAEAPGPFGMWADYKTPSGVMQAYQSIQGKQTNRLPAVVWAHAGFKGINRAEWEKVIPFAREAYFVYMPSFRGEHRNPGNFEMLFGEVDDLLAAVDHVAAELPNVDRKRIYLVGHQEGGTLALLAAATGTNKVRAVFAIGGPVDLGVERDRQKLPFKPDDQELQLRSPEAFVAAIKQPTFYVGRAKDDQTVDAERDQTVDAERMAISARQTGAPFKVVSPSDVSLESVVRLLAAKIKTDTGPVCNIHFD